MMRRSLRRLSRAAAFAVAASLALAAGAAGAITGDEASKKIADAYGVEVLRVREAEIDGRPAWLVTFMNPGGNSNAAFQVNTVAVDRDSGELIPSFQHHPAGYDLPGAPGYNTRLETRPEAMRSGPWR